MRPLTSPINRLTRAPPGERRDFTATVCLAFSVILLFSLKFHFPLPLEFDSLQQLNPNIDAHEMPPKKRLGKELPLEGPFEIAGGQVHETTQTTAQLQTSVELHPTTAKTRRPEKPPEQPPTQVELSIMNTSTLSIQQQPQHQETEAQEHQQQDSDKEIEAIIEDELMCLRQDNERLRLMQEHLARRKAMVKRTQVMQQQIEQERAAQIELQRAIEHLHQ
jgi:hypothetical protein